MMIAVKRVILLSLAWIVALLSIGCGSVMRAGASTVSSRPLCAALMPLGLATREMPAIVEGLNTHSVARTKTQMLKEFATILNADRNVEDQLRSAPAVVRRSFSLTVSAQEKFKTALENATTRAQIRLAIRDTSRAVPPSMVFPWVDYALSECEGPIKPPAAL